MAQLALVNSTLWGNRARLDGGAIYAEAGAIAAINAATIVGNRAGIGSRGIGGGVFAAGVDGGVEVENTILSRNKGDGGPSDCAADSTAGVASGNSNLLTTLAGGCGFTRRRDLVSPMPLLETRRRGLVPRPESPAIGGAGPDAPERDQSGHRRDSQARHRRPRALRIVQRCLGEDTQQDQ